MSDTYNGWTNRETWLINIWFGDHWEDAADVESTRDFCEEEIGNLPNWVQDFIDLNCVDWDELASHFDTEEI